MLDQTRRIVQRVCLALVVSLALVVPAAAQTRFYFPSTTAADGGSGTPAVNASWNQTGANFVRRKLVTTTGGTADATINENSTGAFPETTVFRQYISAPIAAQTLSSGGAWTLKGQMRCDESASSVSMTLAISVRVFSGDGTTLRGNMTGVVASDAADTNAECVAGTLTNRQFQDSTEDITIPLSAVTASDGDRIVVEIGTRTFTSNGGAVLNLSFGDDGAADLAEDTSDTDADNSWIEFSSTITFQGGGGGGSSPARGLLIGIMR